MNERHGLRYGAPAVIGCLAWTVCAGAAWAQGLTPGSRVSMPSLQGPGGDLLTRVNSVGFGMARPRSYQDERASPTGTLSANLTRRQSGFSGLTGFGAGRGGTSAGTAVSAPRGPRPGTLMSPFGGYEGAATLRRAAAAQAAGAERSRSGARFPLPLPGLYTSPMPRSSYVPFAGEAPLVVPSASGEPLDALFRVADRPDDYPPPGQNEFSAALTAPAPSEDMDLAAIMQGRLDARYGQLSARAWRHFEQAEFQQAAACFRTIEEMAGARLDGRSVHLGLLLSYMAEGCYVAAGNQMQALLAREEPEELARDELHRWLFDPARRAVLERHPSIETFRTQRERLREFVGSDEAEPATGLTLCYCLWLEGNSREARDLAKLFASRLSQPTGAHFTRFVELLEAGESGRPPPGPILDLTAMPSFPAASGTSLPRRGLGTREYVGPSGVRAD